MDQEDNDIDEKEAELVKKLAGWFVSGDSGVSSDSMAAIALGADEGDFDAPYDSSDFGRCYRLVKAIPEIRESFTRISELIPVFRGILTNWDELCELYESNIDTREGGLSERIRALRGDING